MKYNNTQAQIIEILGLPDLNLGPMTWILQLDLPKY